jgi:hypothetical protein
MPMPVELELVLDDGTVRQMSLPVEVWFGGSRYNVLVPEAKKVVKVTIDPKKLYPDVRRQNNVWEAGKPGMTGKTGGTGTEGSKAQ